LNAESGIDIAAHRADPEVSLQRHVKSRVIALVLQTALVNDLLTSPTQISTHHPTQVMVDLLLISVS
jgi:hypothetical protein